MAIAISSPSTAKLIATTLLRRASSLVMMLALIILPGLRMQLAAADSVGTKVDTIQGDIDTKLDPGTAKSAPVLTEVNSNAKWLTYVLWYFVPLALYGFLIPSIVIQARANEMDSVKKGIVALVIGSILYFGFLTMFFG